MPAPNASGPVRPAVSAQPVSLCVEVTPLRLSEEAGQTASWAVAVWAEGGKVASAALKLAATPAAAGTPVFSSDCGKDDGTASCDLGPVDASSAARQLLAQVTIPQTSPASAVTLTASVTATGLTTVPQASGSVTIVAAATPTAASTPAAAATPVTASGTGTWLPPFGVPPAAAPSTTLSPGGSAAGLFPAVTPSTTAATHGPAPASEGAVPAANTSALPGGSDSVDAQLAGLAALAVAVFFAVARVSLRWRWWPGPDDTGAKTAAKEAAADQAVHDEKDGT